MYNRFVHRLVAEAFIPNPDNLPCINHKNGNKKDNRIENLEWCDSQYNSRHRATALRKNTKSKELFIHFKTREQKWCCLIPKNGKRVHIGYFNTEQEAINARDNFLTEDPLLYNEKFN